MLFENRCLIVQGMQVDASLFIIYHPASFVLIHRINKNFNTETVYTYTFLININIFLL